MAFFDLTTVAAVNVLLSQTTVTDTAKILTEITNLSTYILTMTDRSYLGGFRTYSERYNGNGSDTCFLRNYPILAVSSLAVNGVAIPASPDYVQPGWAIDTSGSQANLVMIGSQQGGFDGYSRYSDSPWNGNSNAPPLGQSTYQFVRGRMNVAVSYTAGYVTQAVNEAQTVGSVIYTATVINAATFWADQGVVLASTGTPVTGYTVANGVYTFPASMTGVEVLISYQYGAVPADLGEIATKIVATYYRRPKYLDQVSQIQPGVGTTAYSRAEWAPECMSIIGRYKRRFLD